MQGKILDITESHGGTSTSKIFVAPGAIIILPSQKKT
jgi:hypothetical protein